jgi:hypothetical protein
MIEPHGRPHIDCPRCGTCIVWPKSLTLEQTTALAAVIRASVAAGAKFAHDELKLTVRESKALTYHLTMRRGFCHRCDTPVTELESVCKKCRSANLDW